MKNLKFYLTVFAALLMLNLNLQSQTKDCNNLSTPYTMGFENDETDFANWTAIDGNNDNKKWTKYEDPDYAKSGSFLCVISKYNNDWLYTPCFILEAGDSVKISFWYKLQSYMVSHSQHLKLSLRIATPSQDSTLNTTLLDIKDISNTSEYKKAEYYFSPTSSGTYYFGWFAHGFSGCCPIMYLDDIEISKFNCSGITTNLGADRTICKGDTITLDAGESLTDINWSSDLNNHTPYFKIWDAETIILNAKQAHCNVIDTITIYKFTYPEVLNVIAGGDTVICYKDSVMLSTNLLQDDIDNSTIKWYEEDTYSSVGTGATYKAKTPGYYYYKLEHNSLGCKATSNSKTVEVRYPFEGQE
nr:choice-of-anchor J domain-containing protein [Bacteroidales bacterium]